MVGSAAIVTTDTNSSPSIIRVENQSHPPPECSSQNPNYPAAELPSVDSPTPRLPTVRIASEFDSDVSTFFNKVSWRVLNGLAKLKVQFKSTPNGEINNPQISFMTKYLSLLYDFDDEDTLLRASFNPGGMLQVKGVHDVRDVLIIWGKLDKLFPLHKAYELQKMIGENVRLQVIDKASHAPQLERPHLFNEIVKEFILENVMESHKPSTVMQRTGERNRS